MENFLNVLRGLSALEVPPADIPDEIWSVIAEQLEDAIISHSRGELHEFSDALAELWAKLLATAPSSVGDAVLHNQKSSELTSYWLGQLSFAQLLALQTAEKRTHEEFINDMNSDIYKKYVTALSERELTGRDLAVAVKESEESVSRKLKVLRELGITDYRVIGTSRQNFLTPPARLVVQKLIDNDLTSKLEKPKNAMLERYKTKCVSPFMQSTQSFALAID